MKVTFSKVNVPSDGNCFYHTICKFMELKRNVHMDHRVLRNDICKFLFEKSCTIARNLEKINFPMTARDIQEIAITHRHCGVFTDNELIQRVAMKIIKTPIRIYFGSGSNCWNPSKADVNDSCNILCSNSHFQLLLVDEITLQNPKISLK
jgi:hypothetical protein